MKVTRRPTYGPASADGPGEPERERREPQRPSDRDRPAVRLLSAERFGLQSHAGSGTRYVIECPISVNAYTQVCSTYRIDQRRWSTRRSDRYLLVPAHAPNDPV